MDSLKGHPLVVAAAVFAGAIAFFWNFMLPPFVKDKELQIAELNKRIEPLEKSARESADRVATLTSEVKGLKQRNQELSSENIFSTEDVYPKGFRKVRIGDPTSRLWDVYPKTDVKDETEHEWIAVNVTDELIHRVTYYYAKVKGRTIVTGILFETSSVNIPLLKAQLAEKYGSDKVQPQKGGLTLVLRNVLGHELVVQEWGAYRVLREER